MEVIRFEDSLCERLSEDMAWVGIEGLFVPSFIVSPGGANYRMTISKTACP